MERGEWEDDPEYPSGPLPAHERQWRHPSEIGATQWAASEPPLVVGRGLSIATGTVGVALAVGLLWLMVPHHSRSGVTAEASVTSLRSSTATDDENDNGGFLASGTGARNPGSVPRQTEVTNAVAATTIPALSTPMSTPMPTLLISKGSASSASPATALALTPGHFVVTTARAVRGRQGFEVLLPTGNTVVGAVVMVDEAAGTAVLSVPSEIDASVVQLSPETAQVTGIVMTSPAPLRVSVVTDASGVHLMYDRNTEPGEGSLVLDSQGRLLGMCTMSTEGASMVSVDTMLKALDQAEAIDAPAWLGIQPDASAKGDVGVSAVMADGPAAAAGIHPGDVIRSIDGVPIASLDELGTTIAAHTAGQSVTLIVMRKGSSTPLTINITLSRRPDSL